MYSTVYRIINVKFFFYRSLIVALNNHFQWPPNMVKASGFIFGFHCIRGLEDYLILVNNVEATLFKEELDAKQTHSGRKRIRRISIVSGFGVIGIFDFWFWTQLCITIFYYLKFNISWVLIRIWLSDQIWFGVNHEFLTKNQCSIETKLKKISSNKQLFRFFRNSLAFLRFSVLLKQKIWKLNKK